MILYMLNDIGSAMNFMSDKRTAENLNNKHNIYPKMAIFSDLTGFGRCALAEQLPIIAHYGIQGCSVPTMILSNHSAYASFWAKDCTSELPQYLKEWEKLGLQFDGILSGFCGSSLQMELSLDFIKHFLKKGALVCVDPVMGDHGKQYSSISDEVCEKMKELVGFADVITPNWTEVCMLTGSEYVEVPTKELVRKCCQQLKTQMRKGAKIVVTGIQRGCWIENYIYEDEETFQIVRKRSAGKNRCGTGDIFAAIVAAETMCGSTLYKAVKKAADFVGVCIAESERLGLPETDGVCFERFLKRL